MKRAIIALGMLLAWGRGVYGLDPALEVSQYAHTAWTVRDGFFKGAVISIAQTPDGYIWLGTEFGLLRFDGVRAAPWQPPPGEKLPSDHIWSLLAARDGTLWIGTKKGLASWKDGKLTQYAELAGRSISSPLEDREGTIWVSGTTPSTGTLCAIRSGSVQCYGEDGSFGRQVYPLYEDSGGSLWAAVPNGLWRWKPGSPKFYPLPEWPNGLTEGDNGSLLVAAKGGLKQFVDGKLEAHPIPGSGKQFLPNKLLRDHNGGLWIGAAGSGLLHIHQGRMDTFAQADGLSGNLVTHFFEDREGNVWVATTGGLDRFREFPVHTISARQGLSNGPVWPVLAARDGSVWLGTLDGLDRWTDEQITIYRKRNGLPDNVVTSLSQDDRGQIWVCTDRGAAYLQNGRFIPVRGVPVGACDSIAGDSAENLWISNRDHGLFHLLRGSLVERVPWAKLGHNVNASALLSDPFQGGLWLGFREGGVAYFKDGKVRASYGVADGLGEGRLNSLQLDRDGTLWAATEGGLSWVKNGHVATLSSKNGLPCDTVHWVIEDDAHSVWLSLACGLVRIVQSELDAWVSNPKRRVRATVLDSSDGVMSGANDGTVAKTADGKLWFSAFDGVSVVDPRHLPFNKLPPPVHIEQIIADHKTYWENWSGDPSSLQPKLPPLVRGLTIDYTALSMVLPEKVHFRYKLEGWDRDWQEAGNRRQAFYTNLGPRKYRFRVMACNNSGVWNEEGTFLDFSIAPAYWQTNWFRALCVVAFAAILWAIYRLRVGVLEERQALLERQQVLSAQHEGEISALNERLMKAQEEERIRIAGELHDGVLQQLTSLALQLGTATLALPPDSESKAEVREVEKKLIHVGAEIRQLSHELHPAVLHEKGLPDALSAYCEEFSTTRGIPISYEGDESVEELSPGAALCIYRIAQEALGNVAKHAQAKQVKVRLTRFEDRVCLAVSDDGVGFNPDGSGKSGGLGLINMRERVRQLNGTFELESKPGHGTTVKAEVPFRPAS